MQSNGAKRIIGSAALLCVAAAIVFTAGRAANAERVPTPDEHGLYFTEGHAFSAVGPLSEQDIERLAEKINTVAREYCPPSARIFCSVIPDKSLYTGANGVKTVDHEALARLLCGKLDNAQYIELSGALTLADYYTTDSHWRQERLQPVLDALGDEMGFAVSLSGSVQHSLEGFRGMNCRYDADKLPPETLIYLTNERIDGASVKSYERPDELLGVYETEKFEGFTGYDVFLSGPAALLTFEAEQAETGRELVLFRDSFGSSLAPLLLGAYDRITLIDLRYMSSELIPQLAPIAENTDVLFLLSTAVANNSRLLK